MKIPIHFPLSLIDQVRASQSKVGRGAELIQTYVKENVYKHVQREVNLLDSR